MLDKLACWWLGVDLWWLRDMQEFHKDANKLAMQANYLNDPDVLPLYETD